jgi:hypothetical protein
MPLVVSGGIILALLVVMWIAFAKDPGPGPADVAIAYETAWDRLDFDLLYTLSGDELRDGMRREAFVATKRAAYTSAEGALDATVVVGDVVATDQTAVVATRVTTSEGSVQNRVVLERRAEGWLVVGYSIRTG